MENWSMMNLFMVWLVNKNKKLLLLWVWIYLQLWACCSSCISMHKGKLRFHKIGLKRFVGWPLFIFSWELWSPGYQVAVDLMQLNIFLILISRKEKNVGLSESTPVQQPLRTILSFCDFGTAAELIKNNFKICCLIFKFP